MSTTALRDLESILKKDQIKTDEESLKYWGRDWTTYFDIKASAIVFPHSTADVVALVQWARQNKIALIPSGGRTGLSGAAVATNDEVVVSFDQMNKIKEFNSVDQTVVIEPGVVTEALQQFAHSKQLFYPVDFAARGSSQMGGNIATNAGGIKVVRYGLTRDWVVGLTVVTGTGDVLELNNGLVKNATGYDLRHLFIGSEGTLGFITEATIKLAANPPPMNVLVMGVTGLDAVMKIFAEFKTKTPLVAFEMFSDKALRKVLDSTGLSAPLATECPFYVLAEVETRNEQDQEHALGVFEKCLEEGWVLDGVISQSEVQAKTFWRYREDISESLAKYSPYKNDIAVAISKVPPFMEDLDQVLSKAYPNWEVVWFGHIGDGNLHINILRPEGMTKEEFVKECRKVDVMVFDAVKKYKGSISAEHGVGLTKKTFLNYTRSEAEIQLMRGIKKVFDPDNIINPGKVI
ncbi:putative FAD-linked oxidoreductase [Bdellovibrio bacteriovorus]|uniref:FAD-binding oxidoreductase n=1 Tax=Bdellovibrio bacteriovorus TaxID=959 RepID=UPI00045BF33D|nr:FAD-binding oxidoreductase [Bdellovibrio bacteriovorus]AHZ85373.1 FAD-linked oxidase [Bdellovibrio bacteriovorus]BEV69267.1 putative FAD-linked oxidoreductase [Bdellovibrio bacteriovorus]